MSVPLHELLWERNLDLADACLEHRFVTDLADGVLAEEVFGRYVAQDVFFLDSFARAYALAAARSRTLEDLEAFSELLAGAIEERRLHEDYARKLAISLSELSPNVASKAYTDFLLGTAWQSEVGVTLAAMTPCMRLYSYIGSELAEGGLPEHRYRDWIETYSSEKFSTLTQKIEHLLDRHAADTETVRDAYRYAMSCELEFFSAVFDGRKGGLGP